MEMTSHYASFYWIYAFWKEWFDRLINLSFLLPKLFCRSSPPCSLKHDRSLMLAAAKLTDLHGRHLDAVSFCFKCIGREMCRSSALEPEPCATGERKVLGRVVLCQGWMVGHESQGREHSYLLIDKGLVIGSKCQLFLSKLVFPKSQTGLI